MTTAQRSPPARPPGAPRLRLAWALAMALAAAPTLGGEVGPPALVEPPPVPVAASGASGAIDVEAATRAYLDELTPAQKARSDAYFEGGYWLQLWGFLYGAGLALLLLQTGLSARLRDVAERLRWRWLQPAAYWALYLLVTSLLGAPFAIYQDWWRERQYGLSNLTLGGWLGEQLKGLLVGLLLGGLGVAILYAVVRRVGRSWWLWGTAVAMALQVVGAVIAPVAIAPIFNDPRRLADQRVTGPILAMARANGIGTGVVWEIDASRQTNRISANVSGLLGTERITLNDNLLRRAALPEIEAVMAHEMGHYVLNHVYTLLLELGLVVLLGLWLVDRFFERLRRRHEARWDVRSVADPAGLPLVVLLFSAVMFLLTPVTNSIVRVAEQEADLFGLNAAAQPDGFARAALDLSEYRKMEPGPLEELIFYDHPSGRTRIRGAMRWKAEHRERWGGPGPAAAAPAATPAAAPLAP